MITKEQLRECLTPLGAVRITGVHFVGTCFNCGKADHFFINYKTGLNDCKKCSHQGNLKAFLKGVNKLHLLDGEQVDRKQIKPLHDRIALPTEEVSESDLKIRLPIGFKTTSYNSHNKYSEYLLKRGFTKEDFLMYQPGYTNLKTKFIDYVIIPVYTSYILGGYVGRYIGRDPEKRRYENSKTHFADLLFGYDEITKNTHTIILVEGIFDKINVNKCLDLYNNDAIKVCCTFGKKLSNNQIKLLQKTSVANVAMFYDSYDAVNEMKKFGNLASSYFTVYATYYDTPKDPGSMQKAEVIQCLQALQPIDVFIRNKVQKGGVKLF